MSTKITVSAVTALAFSVITASAPGNIPARPDAFFPSQALCLENKETESGITVIKDSGDIEISFKVAEIFHRLFDNE